MRVNLPIKHLPISPPRYSSCLPPYCFESLYSLASRGRSRHSATAATAFVNFQLHRSLHRGVVGQVYFSVFRVTRDII